MTGDGVVRFSMRIQMGSALLAAVFLVSGTAIVAQTPGSVESRIAAQNVLFEEIYQAQLKNSPESATSFGDYRYNDQLDDDSLAAVEREHAADVDNLAKLKAISTDGMAEQDLLSHEIMQRTLEQRIANYGFKEYEMPVNQMSGPHMSLADLPNAVPLDSVKHYEDYIARLHQIPRAFEQTRKCCAQGMKDNLMPVKFLLEKIPAQCDGIVAADPFLNPRRSIRRVFRLKTSSG